MVDWVKSSSHPRLWFVVKISSLWIQLIDEKNCLRQNIAEKARISEMKSYIGNCLDVMELGLCPKEVAT